MKKHFGDPLKMNIPMITGLPRLSERTMYLTEPEPEIEKVGSEMDIFTINALSFLPFDARLELH